MKKVLLVGDYIVDRYHTHTAERLCPEAPVPLLRRTKPAYDKPGGAGLVFEQLRVFKHIQVNPIFTSQSRKERFFADDHLLLRVDEDSEMKVCEGNVLNHLYECAPESDAIVVSDYGKGGLTPEIGAYLGSLEIPVFVDAKTNWHWYDGAFAAFPNKSEAATDSWEKAVFLHEIVKLGSAGCSVDGRDISTVRVPVRDVTGAGDVFLAAFVAAFLHNGNLVLAAQYANRIAGLSVQHVGTYVVPEWDAQFLTSDGFSWAA